MELKLKNYIELAISLFLYMFLLGKCEQKLDIIKNFKKKIIIISINLYIFLFNNASYALCEDKIKKCEEVNNVANSSYMNDAIGFALLGLTIVLFIFYIVNKPSSPSSGAVSMNNFQTSNNTSIVVETSTENSDLNSIVSSPNSSENSTDLSLDQLADTLDDKVTTNLTTNNIELYIQQLKESTVQHSNLLEHLMLDIPALHQNQNNMANVTLSDINLDIATHEIISYINQNMELFQSLPIIPEMNNIPLCFVFMLFNKACLKKSLSIEVLTQMQELMVVASAFTPNITAETRKILWNIKNLLGKIAQYSRR
jgi:hypothetical protein